MSVPSPHCSGYYSENIAEKITCSLWWGFCYWCSSQTVQFALFSGTLACTHRYLGSQPTVHSTYNGVQVYPQIGMLTFSFFWKTIVLLWKWWRKIKNETIVFKTIVLKSLTTTSSLTIVNEERKPTWRACTYHWVVFKKISRNLTSPQLLNFL